MIEKPLKAVKAILLARVSTKEQEDGYSIEAQKYRLQEYCMRKGLAILKIFEFSESSTVGNRKKFQEAIDFAKKQKEVIAVVADKVDRLQRSYKETPLLNDLIERAKIELHFYTENCIIHKHSTSQDRMIWNMFVMMAQNYVDSPKDNVNRSIAQKLRQGEWISTAPIGYLHVKSGNSNDRGKGKIIVDQERSHLIKKIFETYATGSHTLPEILKKTKEWGLRNSRGHQGYLCHSHIHSIITNPFYYGVMRVLKTKKEYPHIYPPIISKELFDACQAVRLGWNKKPFKYGGKEYIFRGLIKCAATDRIVTAATKKKTYINGQIGEWTYLRTWDSTNSNKIIYVKEEKVLEEVENVISHIKSGVNAEQEYYQQRIKELNCEHAKITTRVDKLTDLFLDGDIDKNTYEAKHKQLIQKRKDIIREIENHTNADDKFSELLINLVELASGAFVAFKGATIERKRKLINLVFGNLELKDGKLDFMLRSPFDTFVKCTKIEEWWARQDLNLRQHRYERWVLTN